MMLDDVQKEALKKYGNKKQIMKTIGELNELAAELTRYVLDEINPHMRDKVIQETADVYICLEYVKEVFNIGMDDLLEAKAYKLTRLKNKLDGLL
jgi:predicted house-cleaning noncanonical NTP pyrophosphatase (MazG superfamily)